MNIKLVHNHYDADHLSAVMAEMEIMGAPVIRAVWMECWDAWVALEGCHRIRAAKELGLTPIIENIDYSDESVISLELGFEDDYKVSEVVDDAKDNEMVAF